jgi:hypothetical protein
MMAFKKLYHTHVNPSGDPLFLVVEGMTCEECEKTHDKTTRSTARAKLQAPTNNVAEDKPKPRRKR